MPRNDSLKQVPHEVPADDEIDRRLVEPLVHVPRINQIIIKQIKAVVLRRAKQRTQSVRASIDSLLCANHHC